MERELRRMFRESELFYDAMFCGKMMIGKLDKDVRAKIEFYSTEVHKHYDAFKITIMNRTEGTIDMTVLKFGDILGLKNGASPYYWDEGSSAVQTSQHDGSGPAIVSASFVVLRAA